MHKKSWILYSVLFALSAGAAGTAGFIISPNRVEKAGDDSQSVNNNKASFSDDDDDISGDPFIPVELTAKDHFIDNLTQMKVLHGSASAEISYNEYDISINVNDIYLTLETLTTPELYIDANISFLEKDFPVEVTYANETIYLSMIDNDIKLETSDFSLITDMLSSFDLPEISLPSEITSINLDSVQESLANMEYIETEDGYRFDLVLFEGCPITFYSDKEYNFTGIDASNISLRGINASVHGEVNVEYAIETPVAIPETLDRQFVNFSTVLPLAKHIADLIKQKQFALSLEGSIITKGTNKDVTFVGSTQFDLEKKIGAGRIDITEYGYEKEYNHKVVLDISDEDVVFDYNSVVKGRLRYASLESIIDLVNSLMGNFEVSLPTSLDGAVSLLEGTVLKSVIDGNYEALLDNVIKDLKIKDSYISLTLDKSFLGLKDDISIRLDFNSQKIDKLSIDNITFMNRVISLDIALNEYDENYSTGIDRNSIDEYADAANLVPLVNGIKKLIEQKQFALNVNGSLRKNNEEKGLTFIGSTQFDLDKKTGDGEITITENESIYNKKPTHNVKIGVDNQDVRFNYNDKLNGKFTIQTIKDMFGIVTELMSDQNSRVYQWFGDKIDNMNETVLMRIVHGEWALLFHNIIKEVSLTDSELNITISGDIFNLEDDITLIVGFNEESITSIHLVNFEAIGYVVDLKVDVVDFVDNYPTLPTTEEATYYDFSDIKTLAQLGLNVANLDYFHIQGKANIDMTVDLIFDIDVSSFMNLKDLPIDVEIFENNGEVYIKGSISNVPTINESKVLGIGTGLPKLSLAQDTSHRSSLDFYYENGNFYLARHSFDEVKSGLVSTKLVEVTSYCKTDKEDFVDNILGYLLGWGMRLNECSTIWNKIGDAIEEHKDRTEAMDYASLLTNYAFTDESSSEHGNNRWDIGLNIAELANNDQLKSCDATIYGKEMEFVNPESNEIEVKDFLTHLDANLSIEASILSLLISASLNLNNIDPYLTYEDFETSTLTSTSYAQFKSYVASHQNDSKVNF